MVLTRLHTMSAALIALSGLSYAGDGIVPVRENGRIIFVNAEKPAAPPATPSAATTMSSAPELSSCENAAPQQYVYWSNTKRRWVRVPAPSRVVVRNACSAAQEVEATMAAAPKTNSLAKTATTTTQWTPSAVDGLIDDVARR